MTAPEMQNRMMPWLKAGLGLSLAILAGRVVGFGRELLIAGQFGAERTADHLILLLTFPDVMTNLLTTGAMLYVLVPEFRRRDVAGRRNLFLRVSLLVAGGLGVLVALAAVAMPHQLVQALAPGFSAQDVHAVAPYLLLFALLAPLTGLASVTTAWLQSSERFVLPALGTVILNVCIIAGLIAASAGDAPYLTVGLALLAGGLIRYGSQALALRDTLFGPLSDTAPVHNDLAKRYVMALLAGGLFLLFPMFARAFASEATGGIALLNYSTKLAELPLGIAITVVPVLLLPRMTDALSSENQDGAAALSRKTMFATLALGLAIALPAAWFADTIVAILYGWTNLDPVALKQIAALVTIAFLAIPAQGAISHCMSVLNAANRQVTVLTASLTSLAVFVMLALVLEPRLGLAGITFALAGGYFSGWILLAIRGARALRWRWGDLGLSRDALWLGALNLAIGSVFAGGALVLPQSVMLDVTLGALWFAAALGMALVLYRSRAADF